MKKIILFTIALISGTILFAQHQKEIPVKRFLNNININLLGDASIISLNYERQFVVNSNFLLSSKLGIGGPLQKFSLCIAFCSSSPEQDMNFVTIPHHLTGNLGKGRHFFEFGLGGTRVIGDTSQPYLLYPIIGYRLLPLKSGLSFRIFGQIPFFGLETDDILFIPMGLSFGRSF